jgi:hypothetical protein
MDGTRPPPRAIHSPRCSAEDDYLLPATAELGRRCLRPDEALLAAAVPRRYLGDASENL